MRFLWACANDFPRFLSLFCASTNCYKLRDRGFRRLACPARCRYTTRSPANATMRRGDDPSALPCSGALADALLSGLPSGRGCPDSTAPGLHTVRAPRPLESGGRRRVKEPSGLARVALMHLAHAARWGVPRADRSLAGDVPGNRHGTHRPPDRAAPVPAP